MTDAGHFPIWIVVGPLLAAAIVYLVLVRRMESRRIERRFPEGEIVLSSFGVNYYGLRSEPGGPTRSSGVLVLARNVVYYRARFTKRELSIPVASIIAIDIVESFKGKPLYTKAIQFRFKTAADEEDAVVFRIPYPDRWIVATRGSLRLRRAGGAK